MAGGIQRLIETQNGIVQSYGGMFDTVYSDRTEVNTSTIQGQIEAYTKCTVVQDAIDLKSNYHSTLRIAAINDSGRWLGGNAGTGVEKRTIKADLELLKMFNEYEDFTKFNHHLKTTISIFGIAYVQKVKVIGFNSYNYYIIPNDLITPIYGGDNGYDAFFNQIPVKYQVSIPNGTLSLMPDEVFIFRDNIRGFGMYNSHLSRLVALQEPISALLSANQMFTQLIADGGARGIIGQGAKDLDMTMSPILNAEKISMQQALKQYGKLRGQLKYIITKGAASYVPLTSSIVDMQLPENLLSKKVDVYRGFGIPTAFAVNEARFQVVPEARKEVFAGSVTPEGKAIYNDIFIMKQMPQRAWIYTADDSHHDFFQKGLKDSSIALSQAANGLKTLGESGYITNAQVSDYLDPFLLSQR